MLKRIFVFAAIVGSAVALAHFQGRVVGAVGRGVAVNGEGRRGGFALDVKKAMRHTGGHAELSGSFTWHEMSSTSSHGFAIEMRRVHSVEVNSTHNVCEFSGPARLTRMTPNGPVAVEGRLQCRVEDRRRPMDEDPDLIAWHFASPTTNVSVSFAGAVREGDIKVFARVLGK